MTARLTPNVPDPDTVTSEMPRPAALRSAAVWIATEPPNSVQTEYQTILPQSSIIWGETGSTNPALALVDARQYGWGVIRHVQR
jgi:hypothetical protein